MVTTTLTPRPEQEKTFKQRYFPNRPLLLCPACRKPGYEYILRNRNKKYAYTVHYNEPPIRIEPDGHTRYRTCKKGGRLYSTIDQALEAETRKKKRILQKKRIICPKCEKRGRREEYLSRGVLHAVVVHERIKNKKKTWGKDKSPQYRRCWLGRVPET